MKNKKQIKDKDIDFLERTLEKRNKALDKSSVEIHKLKKKIEDLKKQVKKYRELADSRINNDKNDSYRSNY